MTFDSRKIISNGWGNFPKNECESLRPEKRLDIDSYFENIAQQKTSVITTGSSRSYGDASVTNAYCLNSSRLNKFIEFDIKKGILKCEGGLTLKEIMNIIIPNGWILPVIPGTELATIGGAFACNIHGKNHYKEGDLAKHVKKTKLHLANNKIIECSPRSNKELFWATAGGMGMTGFIAEITIKLKPIDSLTLKSTSQTVGNISEMLDCFYKNKDISDYMIGWIDHSANGKNIGKGVFEKANHIIINKDSNKQSKENDIINELKKYRKPDPKIAIPFYFPPWVLNKYSMKIYNILRFRKYSKIPKEEIIDFDSFFHPLDKIKNWNKLYGKNGFIQYQCLIPETENTGENTGENTAENITKLLTMIQNKKLFSYLAVIKYHGDNNYKNPTLAFTKKGFSLALDFPNNQKVHSLINELNDFIADLGGTIYLAKDALLSKEQFEIMYNNNLVEWKNIISYYDPENIFMSDMSKRLGFKTN